MRIDPRAAAVATVIAVASVRHFAEAASASRCSYVPTWPAAIGPHTYMLGTATADSVVLAPENVHQPGARAIPVQVMAIAGVAGYQSDVIVQGLRVSGGTAAFVRYGIGADCRPFLTPSGDFDSVGVSGLYIGRPRPVDRWIDRRPTFDIYPSRHFPLPQRFNGPSGHLVFGGHGPAASMTATELFSMYRAFWAESVSTGDTSVAVRIRRWVAANRQMVDRSAAREVAVGMLRAVVDARLAALSVPFIGTFEITFAVPGADSLVLYGRTWPRLLQGITDVVEDSAIAFPVAVVPRYVELPMRAGASPDDVGRTLPFGRCPSIYIFFPRVPEFTSSDSTWHAGMGAAHLLACTSPGSALGALARRETMSDSGPTPIAVTFRLHSDGRVSFEGPANAGALRAITIRGERRSTATGWSW